MAVLQNNILAGAAGSAGGAAAADYQIKQSLRFNPSDGSYLKRTPQTAGNRKKFTYSCWFKRSRDGNFYQHLFDANNGSTYFDVQITPNGNIVLYHTQSSQQYITSVAQFRDFTAWYHFVLAVDTTQGTDSNRVKMYINGVQLTDFTFSNGGWPTQNIDVIVNSTVEHEIGGRNTASGDYFGGYLADVHFVDGLQLDCTEFGEFDADTGVWNPKQASLAGTVYNSYLSNQYSLTGQSNLFDGSTSTVTMDWNGVYNSTASPAYRVEFIPPTAISYTSQVEVYSTAGPNAPYSNKAYIDTGSGYGSGVSVVQNGWVTVASGSGSFSKLKVEGQQNGTNMAAIRVDGTILTDSNGYGRNGFHLDFDPTAGATYSDGVSSTSTANSSYPASNGFDGNAGSSGTANWYTQGSNQTITVDLSSYNLSASNSVGFNVRLGGPGNSATVSVTATIGGTAYTQTFQNSSTQDSLLTFNASGAVTTIVATLTQANSSYGWGFTGVQVDGSYLVNNEAPGVDASGNGNHWTATNLAGYTARSPMATTAHRYWRAVIYNHNGSHWPRMSKLYMYEADGTRRTHKSYTSDNCSDQGSIPTNGGVYDTDYGSGNSYSFRNVGIYSSYSGGNRVGRAEVFYSDDNSNWTYSFESIVETNAQCGERTGAVTAELVNGDIAIDTPSNYQADSGNNGGNYATLNAVDNPDGFTLSNGNLETTINTNTGNSASSTIHMTTGKWYWENTVIWNGNDGGATGIIRGGDRNPSYNASNSGVHIGATIFSVDGTITGSQTPSWATQSVEHVIGHALDLDNGEIKFYLNNVLWKTITLPSSTTGWKAHSNYGSAGGSMTCKYNFGQFPFKHTPPTGFKSLCTTNLDTPSIEDGSKHFDAVLWTGNGGLKKVGGGASASEGVTATGTGGVSGISSSYPISGAFDGSTSTYLATNSGNITSNAAILTVTFPSGNQPSYSSSVVLEVWAGTSDTVKVAINGGAWQNVSAPSSDWQSHTVATGSGTISEIKVSRIKTNNNNGAAELRGITVDGVRLLDGTSKSLKFSPDFVWSKTRSHSQNHFLFDTVRGAGRSMRINTSTENGPNTGNDGDLISFNTDGFTLGAGNASGAGAVNNLNQTQVAWTWDGGDLVSNSAYNQSASWSDGVSGSNQVPNLQGFDGSLTTWAAPNSNSTLTWTPPETVTISNTMRVYAAREASGDTITVNFTDGSSFNSFTADNTFRWYTVSSPAGKTISTIVWTHSTSKAKISAIEVDGKILVNAGLIGVGGSNSSAYDQSQTWSSAAADSYGFDGTTSYNSAATRLYGTSTYHKIVDADSPFTNVTSVVVGTSENVGNIKLDGTVYTTSYTSGVGLTVTSPPSSFSDIEVLGASSGVQIAYVKISGVILVDSGVSLSGSGITQYPATPATVRANKLAGFSIISFESPGSNTNIPHGLNQKPEFVVTKLRNATTNTNWCVFHKDLTSDAHVLALDSAYYQESNPTTFNSTAPDSAVIYLGTRGSVSESGKDGIAYAFHSVDGFSKFGSYEGGSAPFVFCGFLPRWVMIKAADRSGEEWVIYDTERDPYNKAHNVLYANTSAQEFDGLSGSNARNIDFLSNGFKVNTGNPINQSGTHVFAAFSENPFKISRAR